MNRRKKPKKNRSRSRNRLAEMVKSPWFLLTGAGIALVSLAAAILGPVPELTKVQTDTASLTAEPVNKKGVTEFVLPLDAPLEEMPPGVNGYCSGPVIEWLKKVGTEIPPYQRISLRNTAQDGAMLSISNVRAIDLRKYDPQPVIHFLCRDGGNADNAVLHLRLDRDPQAQLYDVATQTTKPFAFNLQPGEQGSIELHLLGDTGNSYSGRIVADVATGDKKETVSLPLNGKIDGFNRVSPGKFARLLISPHMEPGLFYCALSPQGTDVQEYKGTSESSDCSPAEVRSLLAEIEDAP